MDGNTRICKKCLLREMDEAGFFQNMYDYIARIPADDKAPEEEYERRLSICKECEKLLSGMCRMCGCYVEMRAAIALRDCPGKKWLPKRIVIKPEQRRLHCGTAREKSGSKRETPHSGSGEKRIPVRGFVNQFVFVSGATFGSLK